MSPVERRPGEVQGVDALDLFWILKTPHGPPARMQTSPQALKHSALAGESCATASCRTEKARHRAEVFRVPSSRRRPVAESRSQTPGIWTPQAPAPTIVRAARLMPVVRMTSVRGPRASRTSPKQRGARSSPQLGRTSPWRSRLNTIVPEVVVPSERAYSSCALAVSQDAISETGSHSAFGDDAEDRSSKMSAASRATLRVKHAASLLSNIVNRTTLCAVGAKALLSAGEAQAGADDEAGGCTPIVQVFGATGLRELGVDSKAELVCRIEWGRTGGRACTGVATNSFTPQWGDELQLQGWRLGHRLRLTIADGRPSPPREEIAYADLSLASYFPDGFSGTLQLRHSQTDALGDSWLHLESHLDGPRLTKSGAADACGASPSGGNSCRCGHSTAILSKLAFKLTPEG